MIKHQHILENKNKLIQAIKQLKTEFIGLDHIIDELQTLIMPWFVFPEAQQRPTVVNLWGLTGTGKTALVKRLGELLAFEKAYVHVDIGEHSQNSEVWLKTLFTDDFYHHDGKPLMICLDEFQFARSLNEVGAELEKDKLRMLWDLLDTGKLTGSPEVNAFSLLKAEQLLMLLDQCIAAGVKMRDGEIHRNLKAFVHIFRGFTFSYHYAAEETIDKKYLLSHNILSGIYTFANRKYPTIVHFEEFVRTLSLKELRKFIAESIEQAGKMKELDLSKALIFVIGNLDEAFSISGNINPDMNADEFYRHTLNINISDIKKALQYRFRNEQIARLGNNHLIYPAFSKKNYEKLIERQLDATVKFFKEKTEAELTFSSRIKQLIYHEGVFPTQGARPVFTTVRHMIEAYSSRIICDLLETGIDFQTVEWKYARKRYQLFAFDELGREVWSESYPVKLKLHDMRKARNDDKQAHTAIHEAGHAILAALTLRILPEVVLSRTAASEMDGFCQINFPNGLLTRDLIRKDIIISLGGWVAEKMIFGEEHTSTGVWADIELATRNATHAIQSYAMGKDPIRISMADASYGNAFKHKKQHDEAALALIKSCEAEAGEILLRNKMLLLKMGEYLTAHSRMTKSQIGKFVQMYSVESWVREEGFKNSEQYFDFKKIIRRELGKMEAKM